MSALQDYQRVPVPTAMNRGLVAEHGRGKINRSQSPLLLNARLNGASTRVRLGYLRVATATTLDTAFKIQGIGWHEKLNQVLIVHNKKLFRLDTTTDALVEIVVAAGQTAISVDGPVNFSDFGFRMFINIKGDGQFIYNSTLDTYQKLEDFGQSVPTGFDPAFGIIDDGLQLVGGVTGDENLVFRSDRTFQQETDIDNIFTFQFSVTSDPTAVPQTMAESNVVKGIVKNMQGVYIFRGNQIDFFSGLTTEGISAAIVQTVATGESTANHRSLVAAGNSIFFLTAENKIKAINFSEGSPIQQTVEVSHRQLGISRIMDEMDEDQSDAFGQFYPIDRLVVFHMKSKGSNFNDRTIVIAIRPDGSTDFSEDTNKFFRHSVSAGNKIYAISDVVPELYIDEDSTSDNGTEIRLTRRTKRFDLTQPEGRKEFREVRLSGTKSNARAATFQVLIDDDAATAPITLSAGTTGAAGGTGTHAVATVAAGSSAGGVDTDNVEWHKVISRNQLRRIGRTIQLEIVSTGFGFFMIDFLEFKARSRTDSVKRLTETDFT